jgi:hypothetical protein
MTAAWFSSIAAVVMCAGGIGGLIWRAGRRDGKIDEILDRHDKKLDDHENRLRRVRL